MATTLEKLREEAMALPKEARAELADLLVQSLDTGSLGSLDRLWAAEAIRRRGEVRSGSVNTIPGNEALLKVRQLLDR
ncbi:MAG: addiction module protein [Blastocatellia bacterium]